MTSRLIDPHLFPHAPTILPCAASSRVMYDLPAGAVKISQATNEDDVANAQHCDNVVQVVMLQLHSPSSEIRLCLGPISFVSSHAPSRTAIALGYAPSRTASHAVTMAKRAVSTLVAQDVASIASYLDDVCGVPGESPAWVSVASAQATTIAAENSVSGGPLAAHLPVIMLRVRHLRTPDISRENCHAISIGLQWCGVALDNLPRFRVDVFSSGNSVL